MPEFHVEGANRRSGRDVSIVLSAASKRDAETQAADLGVVVSRVEPAQRVPSPPAGAGVVAGQVVTMGGSCLSIGDGKRIARSVAVGVFFAQLLWFVLAVAALIALPEILRTMQAWAGAR